MKTFILVIILAMPLSAAAWDDVDTDWDESARRYEIEKRLDRQERLAEEQAEREERMLKLQEESVRQQEEFYEDMRKRESGDEGIFFR